MNRYRCLSQGFLGAEACLFATACFLYCVWCFCCVVYAMLWFMCCYCNMFRSLCVDRCLGVCLLCALWFICLRSCCLLLFVDCDHTMCTYVYIYIYIYTHIHLYIYILFGEREREITYVLYVLLVAMLISTCHKCS